ncbi:alpha/beta hydrolase [Inhella gelatinilytica]|uniref:Alpha/beta hydrolase n=1 Tax=Inhella gelatinilytica TaxID=2795030 RepID=A0A931NAV7_9BURK|nr:alpha/beta hydrolase [Inhella gelatinilytica]MBH9552903.1 alpha/beta hydrolase [Inhella gelatinilytica]
MSTLLFSHANSYPASCYRLLFEQWRAAGHTVLALPQYGHDPRFPVRSNWNELVAQLLDFADAELPPTQPRVLVGHSLGGALSLLAACKRPATVQAVVMLDTPYVSGWRARVVQAGKASGWIHRVPPAAVAQRRRNHWPDRQSLETHFRSKPYFQAWDPRVLQDYLDTAFEPDPERGGWRLTFLREVETAIYATLPHHLNRATRGLRVPVGLIAGRDSEEMRQGGWDATQRFVGPNLRIVEGGHLFPFVRPETTAHQVLDLIEELVRG